MSRPDTKAIRERMNAVDLPKLHAYGEMELTSPGARKPLDARRVLNTVETMNAALEALSERMVDGRALCDRVEALEATLRNLVPVLDRVVSAACAKSPPDCAETLDALDAVRAALEGE